MSTSLIQWQWSSYDELSRDELYQIMRLRQEVFVVEQDCAYLDADGVDQSCWHLMGWQGNALVAYARVVAPGIKYQEPSIGRVLSSDAVRGTGAGRELLAKALEHLFWLYPKLGVRISAQCYLEKFYASFGFETVSEPYDEDGIPHVEMVRPG